MIHKWGCQTPILVDHTSSVIQEVICNFQFITDSAGYQIHQSVSQSKVMKTEFNQRFIVFTRYKSRIHGRSGLAFSSESIVVNFLISILAILRDTREIWMSGSLDNMTLGTTLCLNRSLLNSHQEMARSLNDELMNKDLKCYKNKRSM